MKRNKKKILCLKDNSSEWCWDQYILLCMAVEFYRNLYTVDCEPLSFDLQAGSYPVCLAPKLALLSKPFSPNEVHATIFSMDSSKAPSSNRFPAGFY